MYKKIISFVVNFCKISELTQWAKSPKKQSVVEYLIKVKITETFRSVNILESSSKIDKLALQNTTKKSQRNTK